MRDENQAEDGSSPRVRGTLCHAPRQCWRIRFIPACAGNTASKRIVCIGAPVHPRVCGEHSRPPPARPRSTGSSPRVRGTPRWRAWPPFGAGFIPACAGNTLADAAEVAGYAVHPRVCGEHSRRVCHASVCGGSSPRVRGTLRGCQPPPVVNGSSPRVRGTPTSQSRSGWLSPVHPRVCGEHAR